MKLRSKKPMLLAASRPTLAKNARMEHPRFVLGNEEQSVEKAGSSETVKHGDLDSMLSLRPQSKRHNSPARSPNRSVRPR